MKKKSIVVIISILLIFIILGGITTLITYRKLSSPAFDLDKDVYIYINEDKNYNDILFQLENTAKIKNSSLFIYLASVMKYPDNIKAGRYKITPEISYLNVVRLLRSGNQSAVKLTFNNIRYKQNFAERIGEQLMFDKDSLLKKLNDNETVSYYDFDTTTITCMFIPNTYEFYWDTSMDHFLNKMKKEYDSFWNDDRKNKASGKNLTPIEVSILASIVEEETAKKAEYPIVAGLYINRLKKGMLLQADPTVKYAVGDVSLRRILFKHLEVNSPYNTYKNQGLPPGPIRIPSIAAMDGVLNAQEHSYLYMCAKEDFSGCHNFATTLKEHTRNAQKYQAALNKAGIR